MSGITVGSLDDIALAQAGANPDRGAAQRMLAAGMSERQVAERMHVSPSTVHRWRAAAPAQETAPAAPAQPPAGEQDPAGTQVAPEPDGAGDSLSAPRDWDGELAALAGEREQLAGRIATLEERAGQARAEVTQIELERRERLRNGGDGTGFAARRRQALDAAEDLQASAAVLREDLAALDARAALTEAERAAEEEAAAVARIMAQARVAAGDLPDLVQHALADLGPPVTFGAAVAFLERVTADRARIDEGALTPERAAEQEAHAARNRAEWDAAQERQAAEEARVVAKQRAAALADRNSYLPRRVAEREGRVFTGPPPFVFGQLGR